MKDRYVNLCKWIIGGGMLSVALALLEFLLVKFITQNNPEVLQTYTFIMVFITMSVYLVVSIVKAVQYFKWDDQNKLEKLEEAKKTLSSDFKAVLLNYSSDIPAEKFECQAKVDEDGKIVCKIHLDLETKLDSYEDFQKYFHFAEK